MLWRHYLARNAGKRNYCFPINGKKSITRLKNCVNILTCGQISYERTNGPFKETYGETFWNGSFRSNVEMTEKKLPFETRISGKNVERTKQVACEHYDMLLWNKFYFLLTQFAFGIQASETIFSWVSVRCLIVLWNFHLPKWLVKAQNLLAKTEFLLVCD